ncbi:methyl-accepting chemotaxis protein [Salibacterium qingdaonense]|uniref:Methyl-accepting chemotaxis protein n=1 Tax=Salibacterium qingdaonense TaxID=266892 RepID=A0A1I4NET8_9BACI|nr:methyl-accepting chemotaxis protein [Salibacterium qingdaonense]SFM13905.1 Methyl-accepting chemotaxis protein [Salibacterium qingdaonense]
MQNDYSLYQRLLVKLFIFSAVAALIPAAAVWVVLITSGTPVTPAVWSAAVISLIIVLAAAWFYLRLSLRPLRNDQAKFQGEELSSVSGEKDEDFDQLAQQTLSVSSNLKASTKETSQAVDEIATTVQELASGTDEQVKTIQDINGTSSQIFFTLQEISESITFVSESSKESIARFREGDEAVRKITDHMDVIGDHVNQSVSVVGNLGQKTEEIGSILTLITDISDQTNLLALNAAIEAARAGEHGKGFSVVADEVRKLAEQTNQATGNIRDLVNEIQEHTNQAVRVIEKGGDSVEEGKTLNHNAGRVFQNIHSGVEEMDEFIQDISTAIGEVTGNMNQVAGSLEKVSDIVSDSNGSLQNSAAVIEEVNASMQEVSSSAETLSDIIGQIQEKNLAAQA